MKTRPEPTIIWQLRKLELHCRQKVLHSQPENSKKNRVAGPQQKSYAQDINTPEDSRLNQRGKNCDSPECPQLCSISWILRGALYPYQAAKRHHSTKPGIPEIHVSARILLADQRITANGLNDRLAPRAHVGTGCKQANRYWPAGAVFPAKAALLRIAPDERVACKFPAAVKHDHGL